MKRIITLAIAGFFLMAPLCAASGNTTEIDALKKTVENLRGQLGIVQDDVRSGKNRTWGLVETAVVAPALSMAGVAYTMYNGLGVIREIQLAELLTNFQGVLGKLSTIQPSGLSIALMGLGALVAMRGGFMVVAGETPERVALAMVRNTWRAVKFVGRGAKRSAQWAGGLVGVGADKATA